MWVSSLTYSSIVSLRSFPSKMVVSLKGIVHFEINFWYESLNYD